jgi:WD40 repeat protein
MATPEDGVLIKFVSENGTLQEKSRAAFPMPSADAFASFQLSPSGRYLWTGSLIVEVATGKVAIQCERAGLESPKTGKAAEWIGDDRVVELVLVPRDKKNGRALGLQYTRSLVEWGIKSNKPKHLFASERALSFCPSPDGRSLAEAGEDGRLRILDMGTFRNRLGEDAFQFSTRPLVDVAWHPKLPLLAVLARDLSVTLWNSETGAEVENLGQVPTGAAELEWSPGGETLLSKHKVEGTSSFYLYAPAAVAPPKPK